MKKDQLTIPDASFTYGSFGNISYDSCSKNEEPLILSPSTMRLDHPMVELSEIREKYS